MLCAADAPLLPEGGGSWGPVGGAAGQAGSPVTTPCSAFGEDDTGPLAEFAASAQGPWAEGRAASVGWSREAELGGRCVIHPKQKSAGAGSQVGTLPLMNSRRSGRSWSHHSGNGAGRAAQGGDGACVLLASFSEAFRSEPARLPWPQRQGQRRTSCRRWVISGHSPSAKGPLV